MPPTIFFMEVDEWLLISPTRLGGILEGCGKAVLELIPSIFVWPPMTEVLFFLCVD